MARRPPERTSLWVSEKDTTMRDRSFAISRPLRSRRLPARRPAGEFTGLEVARHFTPEQLDLDDLARSDSPASLAKARRTASRSLLLAGHRGSHVVGNEDAP